VVLFSRFGHGSWWVTVMVRVAVWVLPARSVAVAWDRMGRAGRVGLGRCLEQDRAGPVDALRGGGRAVDFRGQTHLGVLERMGVLEDLRRVQTGGTVMRFIDERGRKLMELPADFAGGDLEVLRSDLFRVLYEHSTDTTEYLFGDGITAMTQQPGASRSASPAARAAASTW
jgi:hypothetical protein